MTFRCTDVTHDTIFREVPMPAPRATKDENGTERFNVLTFKRANAFS